MTADLFAKALAELETVTIGLDDTAVDRACKMIASAGRIVVYGCGREGLQLRGLAMRLHHLGLDVSMQGDMSAPPLGPGDLFICSAGPGTLATVDALVDVAKVAGASILFLTAQADAPAAAKADQLLIIPAQTMASDQGAAATSVLPMGSLYEGAMFVLFEVIVLRLQGRLRRHAEAAL